jgi:hypothetical protein
MGLAEEFVVELDRPGAGLALVEVVHVELAKRGSTCRTNEERLLCLKWRGRSWAQKACSSTTSKAAPSLVHRTTFPSESAYSISQVFRMKVGTELFRILLNRLSH